MRSSQGAAQAVWEERRKSERRGLLAGRFDLSDAMRHGIAPPDIQEPGVLIRGNRHMLFGVTANGKTWVLLYLAKQAIKRGERVMYLDSEMGARVIVERLKLLGVTAEEVADYLYYFPFPTLDPQNVRDYEDALDEIEPELILFDSWAAFLSQAGLEENSNKEVEDWAIRFLTTAKAREITSVVLDHTPREDDRERGASRKREHVDVAWSVKQTRLFTRDSVGEITLTRKKDRECWLPLTVKFAVGGGARGFVFSPSDGMADEAPPSGQDTRDKILAVLVDQFGQSGARHTDWLRATQAIHNIPKPTFDRHKRKLVELGITLKKEDGLFYPVIPTPPDDVIPGDTNLDTNRIAHKYHESTDRCDGMIPSDTKVDTTRGIKVSPASPPIRGNGDTNLGSGLMDASADHLVSLVLQALEVERGGPRAVLEDYRNGQADFDRLVSSVAVFWLRSGLPASSWKQPTVEALAALDERGGANSS